jgi:hypothetical protein
MPLVVAQAAVSGAMPTVAPSQSSQALPLESDQAVKLSQGELQPQRQQEIKAPLQQGKSRARGRQVSGASVARGLANGRKTHGPGRRSVSRSRKAVAPPAKVGGAAATPAEPQRQLRPESQGQEGQQQCRPAAGDAPNTAQVGGLLVTQLGISKSTGSGTGKSSTRTKIQITEKESDLMR